MTQQFGSPNRNDPTAKLERQLQESTDILVDQYLTVGPTIMNRNPGTQPIPKKEQVQDYFAVIDDGAELQKRWQMIAVDRGPDRADLEMRQWEAEMLKEINNGD